MRNLEWKDVENTLEQKLMINGTDKFEVVLFGAGNAGLLALNELRQRNIEVAAFCDNDVNKQGQSIESIPCISAKEIKKFKNPLVLITSLLYYNTISKQLDAMHLPYIFVDGYAVVLNLEKFKLVYNEYLYDEKSKHVFCALLIGKLCGSYKYFAEAYDDCFYYELPTFKFLNSADVIVDCGAFVGDTIEEFIEKRNKNEFKKIYAFEPGEKQFEALNKRMKRLTEEWALLDDQIVCVNSALGEISREAYLNITSERTLNTSFISDDSSINELNQFVKIVALDDYFKDKNEKITFIKADIEGFELEMLKGAKNLIQKYKPNIALSIYHKWEDFFEIPQYLKFLVPEYNISVRHHGHTPAETVCYCSVMEF